MPSPFPNVPHSIRGTLTSIEFTSHALQGNIWDDPHIRDLWIHLPHHFDPQQSYPLLIILTGFAGTGEGLFSRSLTDSSLCNAIDRLIDDNQCPPFITLFPDCMSYLGGSQFLDSPAIGNYEQYLIQEIIPAIQAQYTISNIAIMGHSSGGYGALRLAMTNPNLFSAIACHAGDLGFSSAYSADLAPAVLAIHQAGSPKKFLEEFWKKHRFSAADFSAFNILCMAAAYDPNPEHHDFPANLPFDYTNGTIDFQQFDGWKRHDPLYMIDSSEHQKNLLDLSLLYIECGRSDEYLLQFGARKLVQKLQKYSIPHRYEEFDGGHRGGRRRLPVSIPQLINACS